MTITKSLFYPDVEDSSEIALERAQNSNPMLHSVPCPCLFCKAMQRLSESELDTNEMLRMANLCDELAAMFPESKDAYTQDAKFFREEAAKRAPIQ